MRVSRYIPAAIEAKRDDMKCSENWYVTRYLPAFACIEIFFAPSERRIRDWYVFEYPD
jgi:hypothetical protein